MIYFFYFIYYNLYILTKKTRDKRIDEHIYRHWQRSVPDIKKITVAFCFLSNEFECFPTGSNLPYVKLFQNIMIKMQCFRGKQNTSGWNDIVLRQQSGYMGPKQKGINSYVANNVRKISWPFVFSFAMDIDQTDEDDRGWVRLTAIFNIFKILTSKILKKIRVNQTPTLFNKRHRRPNILFIYFHTRCFDIMVQFT